MSEARIEKDLEIVSLDEDGQTECAVPWARPVEDDVENNQLGEQVEIDNLKGRRQPFIIKNAFEQSTHPGSTGVTPWNNDDNTVREIECEAEVFSSDADPSTVGRAHHQRVKWSSWRSPFVRFFTAWSSTVPDAVGVPGLRYVVSKQDGNRRRLLWFLAIIMGLVAAGYQVTDRASYLMGNPQRVDLDIVYHENLAFPAITICNYNNIRSDMLADKPVLSQFLADINNLEGREVNFTAYKQHFEGINTTELYLQLAHQVGEMINHASWNNAPMSPSHNFKTVITDYGVCHTFNGGYDGQELLQVNQVYSAGLQVYLNIQQYNYHHFSWARGAAGVLVVVHDQEEIPLVESFGIAVSAGTHAKISLKKKTYVNKKPPIGSTELKYFNSYTKKKCQLECLIDHVHGTCGCVESYMAAFATDKRVCDLVEVFQCSQPETKGFAIGKECRCPVPYIVNQFVPFVSHAKYPSNFYVRQFTQHFSASPGAASLDPFFDKSLNQGRKATDGSEINHVFQMLWWPGICFIGKNLMMLEIYYEDTSVDKSVQYEAYNFFGFLCDMGGAIGLWLGGSILTFLEIVEHVYHTMFVNGDAFRFTQ